MELYHCVAIHIHSAVRLNMFTLLSNSSEILPYDVLEVIDCAHYVELDSHASLRLHGLECKHRGI